MMNELTTKPLYAQVKEQIMNALTEGRWTPGNPIPTELALAELFKVSQGTVRRALDDLVNAHFLVRQQGKGTFVATHQTRKAKYRFMRLEPDDGMEHDLKRELIGFKEKQASDSVSQALTWDPSSPAGAGPSAVRPALALQVFEIQRLLVLGGKSVVLETIELPVALFQGLTEKVLRESSTIPLYSLFERQFAVQTLCAYEKIRAIAADAWQAKHLYLSIGAPLLQVERVSYTFHHRPVEYRKVLSVTNDFYYVNELD